MLCQTDKLLEEEIETAHSAKREGLEAKEVSLEELKRLEPNVQLNVKGATFYDSDSHTTPHEFMEEMKSHLKKVGVIIHYNEKVEVLQMQSGTITSIMTDKQSYQAD